MKSGETAQTFVTLDSKEVTSRFNDMKTTEKETVRASVSHQTLKLADTFWLRNMIEEPQNLADVNIECLDDGCPKLQLMSQN